MPKYKLIYDNEKCIGCLSCLIPGKKFLKESNDKPILKGGKKSGRLFKLEIDEKDLKLAKKICEVCPVQALYIVDKGGKIVD